MKSNAGGGSDWEVFRKHAKTQAPELLLSPPTRSLAKNLLQILSMLDSAPSDICDVLLYFFRSQNMAAASLAVKVFDANNKELKDFIPIKCAYSPLGESGYFEMTK
jgi:hypothetical protein